MKKIILENGVIVDYQTLIEEVVGNFVSQLDCYDANWDEKTEINGKKIDKSRAYFVPNADYEMVIVKKTETMNRENIRKAYALDSKLKEIENAITALERNIKSKKKGYEELLVSYMNELHSIGGDRERLAYVALEAMLLELRSEAVRLQESIDEL